MLSGQEFEKDLLQGGEEEDSINTMNSLMMEEIGGDAKEYYNYNNRINSVKLEDVRSLARLKNFSTFSLVPAD